MGEAHIDTKIKLYEVKKKIYRNVTGTYCTFMLSLQHIQRFLHKQYVSVSGSEKMNCRWIFNGGQGEQSFSSLYFSDHALVCV